VSQLLSSFPRKKRLQLLKVFQALNPQRKRLHLSNRLHHQQLRSSLKNKLNRNHRLHRIKVRQQEIELWQVHSRERLPKKRTLSSRESKDQDLEEELLNKTLIRHKNPNLSQSKR
jgi:hypothetical protein